MRTFCFATALGLFAASINGCNSDTANGPSGDGKVAFVIVNGAEGATGGQLTIDNAAATFPTVGQSATFRAAVGTHLLTLTSSSGAPLATASITLDFATRRAAVVTGATTITMAIATDTIAANSNGGYRSAVGSILFVNALPGAGQYDIVLKPDNSDSTYRLGGFSYGGGAFTPPGGLYSYYIPFPPANYVITLTNPGDDVTHSTIHLTLADNDKWTVMLVPTVEGDFDLQAMKQQ